ncbi:MAG: alpha-mannosidase, partial [Ilumatobacteraceae bacterium]
MHDDRELVEQRIRREMWERVLPLVHRDRRPLSIDAGADPERLTPFAPGTAWGAPWSTTWFRLRGEIPADWAGERVEAVIDLGFTRAQPGFQCEGLVVEVGRDGRPRPVQGIHPERTNVAVSSDPGPVELLVEAASNPSFPQFRPSPLGSKATAGQAPLYRFRSAHLVVVDDAAEALAHDIDVLEGLMRSLPLTEPRRARLLGTIAAALDALPDVERARAVLAPQLADVRTAHRHRIVATGHAHIDTAWLWPTSETVRKCARTFSSAVALMDENPDYRFACSQAQQYAWIERDHPELFEAVRGHVDGGQWIPVGGMWVEADMNLPAGESLVRQIVHGQRYFERHFGRRCTEVWIPDVFGYPAGLPQVFAAGGMNRFVTQKLSWNKQNRFPHHTFWWEGLDGTRVLTHFPPVDTYNAEVTAEELGRSMADFRDHRWSAASLMPFGFGDGGGGPTREMLERARRLAVADSRATVELGAPSDFFELVERESFEGADVPVWRGELYFETHRGTLTSQLRTKLGNRRCERLLVEAELWAAAGRRDAEVDELWQEVLTQQFHDILPGSSIRWVHDDAEAVFERVGDELERRIAESLASIVPAGPWLANPADVAVDDVVVTAADALDGVDAEPGTTQRLADGRCAFAASVPAFGVTRVEPQPVGDQVVVTETSMANGHLAVRWDAAGELISIIDIGHSRELVPDGERMAGLELAVDHPVEYDAWDLESWTRRGATPVGGAETEVLDRGPLVGRRRVTRR